MEKGFNQKVHLQLIFYFDYIITQILKAQFLIQGQMTKSCRTDPKERKELGKQCEFNLQKEYENEGYKVAKLSPNAPADLLIEKDGHKTFIEAKAGGSDLTPNETNFQNQIKRLGNNKIDHKIRRCDCEGNPLPEK